MTIFYYTATGNSLTVAKAFGGRLISIPQIDHEESLRFTDDAIGIIFPVFHFTAPRRVQVFIRRAHFDTDYLFLIANYGNLPAGAAARVQEIAEAAGHHPAYVNQIVMLDNAIDFFDMDEQRAVLPGKDVPGQITKLLDDVNNRRRRRATATSQEAEATKMNGMNEETVNVTLAQTYTVSDDCVLCGTCAKVCPAGNISVTDKVVFYDRCECCLACIHNCPQKAIHHPNEKSGARWRNPEIKLSEIIASNQQHDHEPAKSSLMPEIQ